ncbi:MAG: cytidylyltransferase domain-containing protein [Promethearchaeota archaeon]
MNRKKFISLIPARGGSKGIPKKNIKKLYNKPLIAYSIEQSLNSKIICETYVSTEDNSIKEISSQYGAKVIERPFVLATDTASTESVMIHAAEYLNYDFDYMVLLQPTSPLRFSWQIDEAIELLLDNSADSLLSVCENNSFLWDPRGYPINYDFKNRPRRQDKIWELRENGSIYITKKEILLKEKNRLGGKIVFYKMPEWMSFEIDNFFDFQLIEWIIKTKFIKENKNLKKLIKKIKLFICDVDGVFTNGSVYLDSNGNEILKFSRIDGKGIELLKEKGIPIAIISSENSEIIKLRMRKLKINDIFVGEKEKFKIYTYLKEKYSLKDEEICYLGDDIQDLEIIRVVGLSCCPDNAQEIIKENCVYVSPFKGGKGFVRDVCNLILENL